MSFKRKELEEIIRRLINGGDTSEQLSRDDFKSLVFYAIDESAETDNKHYNMMMEVIRDAFQEKIKYIKTLEEENDRLKLSINQLRAKAQQNECGCGCDIIVNTDKMRPTYQVNTTGNATEISILKALAFTDNPEAVQVVNGIFTEVNLAIKKKLVDAKMITMFCGNEEPAVSEPEATQQETAIKEESVADVDAYESCAKIVELFTNKLVDSSFEAALRMEADTDSNKHFVEAMDELANLINKYIGVNKLNKDSYDRLHTECEDFKEALDIIRKCIANGEAINPFGVKEKDELYPYLNGLADDINELIDDNTKYKKCISNQVQTMYLMLDHITDLVPTKANESLGDWEDDEYFDKQFKKVDSKFIKAYNGLIDKMKEKDEFITEIVRLSGFIAARPTSIHPGTFRLDITNMIIEVYNSINEEFYSYIAAAVYRAEHKIVTPLDKEPYPETDSRYKLTKVINDLIIDNINNATVTINNDKTIEPSEMDPKKIIGTGVPFLGLFKIKNNKFIARVACFMKGKKVTEYYSGKEIDGELVIAVPIPDNLI